MFVFSAIIVYIGVNHIAVFVVDLYTGVSIMYTHHVTKFVISHVPWFAYNTCGVC